MHTNEDKPGVTSKMFFRAWETSASIEQVALTLHQPLIRVCAWERRCRRDGVHLKELPRPRRPIAVIYGPSDN
jgi:hypothetical protein